MGLSRQGQAAKDGGQHTERWVQKLATRSCSVEIGVHEGAGKKVTLRRNLEA